MTFYEPSYGFIAIHSKIRTIKNSIFGRVFIFKREVITKKVEISHDIGQCRTQWCPALHEWRFKEVPQSRSSWLGEFGLACNLAIFTTLWFGNTFITIDHPCRPHHNCFSLQCICGQFLCQSLFLNWFYMLFLDALASLDFKLSVSQWCFYS